MKCPACHADNPDAHNFYGECGTRLIAADAVLAPLAPAAYAPPHLARCILTCRSAPEGERKRVSVLVCDIAQSTEHPTRAPSMEERFDRTTAALEEPGVRFDLDVACTQRAIVLQEPGHRGRTRADLEHARRCFKPATAAPELASLASDPRSLG